MKDIAIPYVFMRGGTSRGPYFNKQDLPDDLDSLSDVLMHIVGAGHPINIDGIGGGNPVTTKVAILCPSTIDDCDIDYFFAQVGVEDRIVDYKPTCGNILSGVGPAAIEMGLIKPVSDQTTITIHAVNTGARIKAVVETPDSQITYKGNQAIDGVHGTAAPIMLHFMNIVGSKTGKLFPTGQAIDNIDHIDVTCIDVTMPMVIARAEDFGITGYESCQELNDNKALFAKIEKTRIQAGAMMGLGDVSQSVTPKFALIAPPRHKGTITTRYFMPWKAHPTMAVTGGQCIASCSVIPGSIADGIAVHSTAHPTQIVLEHPMGTMNVVLDYQSQPHFNIISAGVVRTARKIAEGHVFVREHLQNRDV